MTDDDRPKGVRDRAGDAWAVLLGILEGLDNWVHCCATAAQRRYGRLWRRWLAHQRWIPWMGMAVLLYLTIHSSTVSTRAGNKATHGAKLATRAALTAVQTAKDEATDRANIAATAAAVAVTKRSAVQGCQRFQIINAVANRNTLGDYLLLLAEIRELAGSGVDTTKFEQAAATYEWVPRGQPCQQRVNRQGLQYQIPAPIPFAEKMPPPSALTAPGVPAPSGLPHQ